MTENLVSVIITSYNSSNFIIETLQSVLNQTWKAIELIITDDCSGDNTIEVCRIWLEKNRQRFINAEIVTNSINTGVSANANRGLYIAKGDWVKFLGADDTLKKNCIEDNMVYIGSNPGVKALFSRVDIYDKVFSLDTLIITSSEDIEDPTSIMASDRSADSQYRMLLTSDRLNYTPSVFLYRETLLSIGGFDERFRLLEDYPLWLNLTKNGHRLNFMDRVTVNYRRHSGAINNTGINFLINPNYFRSESFRKAYTYPYMPVDIWLNQRFFWYASQLFRFDCLNRNNKSNKFLLNLLTVYFNPVRYFIWLKKRLNKRLKNKEFYI